MFAFRNCRRKYYSSYLRLINKAEINTMLMRSDIKKAAIQNVPDATSVFSTFRTQSVQTCSLALINYNRKHIFIIRFYRLYFIFYHIIHHKKSFRWIYHRSIVQCKNTNIFSIVMRTILKIYFINNNKVLYIADGICYLW